MTEQTPFLRRIRSFVRREGRLTQGQQRAIDEQWPRFGIDNGDQLLDLDAIFSRSAPKVLEIGFGNGDSLAAQAEAQPDKDFLGIEVHRPGVGSLLRTVAEKNLSNVRVICDDAVEVLGHRLTDNSLDCVQLFFADPWHKKKHHKRRILQPVFVALLADKLKPGGMLHCATDWQDYAEHMIAVLNDSPVFTNLAQQGDFIPRPAMRPLTKFEQRGHRLGHGVWDIQFIRNG